MAAPIAACIRLHFSRSVGFLSYEKQLLAQRFTTLKGNGIFRCLNTSQQHLTRHSDLPGNQPPVIPVDKLKISYSRSSGPGGQHVNKVNTKAEVRFHVQTAVWIPEEVRNKIILKVKRRESKDKNKTRINKAGELIITSEISRSQQKNLEDCLQKISVMITEASQKPPEPSEDDIALRAQRLEKRNLERLKQKKMQSVTKRGRQADFD